MGEQKTLKLEFLGRDSWDRPVYKTESGCLVVDVDPRKNHGPDLCTKYNNEFNGEPEDPISKDWIPEFTPNRVVWY